MVGVLLFPLLAVAQEPPNQQLGGDIPLPPKPAYSRLDSQLNRMVEQLGWRSAAAIAGEAPLNQAASVAVTIRLSGSPPGITNFLGQNGATVANVGVDYIEAYVPITMLPALQAQSGVLRVETIIPPRVDVTSQGTTVHNSPTWNAKGFTGAGVKVGVIDGGFIGYSGLMGTELPSTVTARCYTLVGVFSSTLANCETDTVHGTAVAEAVVDVAPDVILYIANPSSGADLQNTASWMVAQGVQVINYSVGWVWRGPGDGTSPFSDSPLGAVDIAVAGGTLWVNSAGNAAADTWTGGYSDADTDGWHEFSGGSEVNRVNLSAGETLTAQIRWDDNWGNAARDFDLYLSDLTPPATIVAFGGSEQSGDAGQAPYEWLTYTAPTTCQYITSQAPSRPGCN